MRKLERLGQTTWLQVVHLQNFQKLKFLFLEIFQSRVCSKNNSRWRRDKMRKRKLKILKNMIPKYESSVLESSSCSSYFYILNECTKLIFHHQNYQYYLVCTQYIIQRKSSSLIHNLQTNFLNYSWLSNKKYLTLGFQTCLFG